MDVAVQGKEALEILKKMDESKPYNIIFMDCQMPIMDGYETSRNIRQGAAGDYYRNIPIVAMTANAMKGDDEKCYAAGMDYYVPKPVDVDVLINCLFSILLPDDLPPKNKSKKVNFLHHSSVKAGKQLLIDHPVWDKKSLLKRVNNRADRVIKIIAMFQESLPERLELLESYDKDNNTEELRNIVHAIKGIAANIGAQKAYQCACDLENSATETGSNTLKIAALKQSLNELNEVFEDHLNSQNG